MNGLAIRTLKDAYKVIFRSYLKSYQGGMLKPQVTVDALSNLTYKPLERSPGDQVMRRLLILSNLAKLKP